MEHKHKAVNLSYHLKITNRRYNLVVKRKGLNLHRFEGQKQMELPQKTSQQITKFSNFRVLPDSFFGNMKISCRNVYSIDRFKAT